MIDDRKPGAGRKKMYTSGWPKNQNRCCHRSASPPSAWLKNWELTNDSRSADSMVLHIMTDGMANRTMNDVTRLDQTNRGMRLRVIPGARSLNTVVMMATAPAMDAVSTRVTIWLQTSYRLPGVNSGPERGVYANHPMSGPVFVNNPANR